jgi:hypothetical protein
VTEALACPGCGQALEPPSGLGLAGPCPRCGLTLLHWAGPLFFRPAGGRAGARAASGDSVCFFHASRRAETSCGSCGRFLCALCDIPMGGDHLCPSCLEEGRSPQAQALQSQRRTRVERLVFVAALLSLIPPFVFLSFLSAPFLCYFSVRGWFSTAPLPSFTRRGARLRLAAALAIGLCEAGVWLWYGGRLALKLLG